MAGKYKSRLLSLALFACALLVPAPVHAANNCPWLNEATASGYLGGNAVGTFVAAAQSTPASCTFVQNEASGTRNLVITVEGSSNARARLTAVAQGCGASQQPVSAIGNEALRCIASDRGHGRSERIIGRVRDQVFSVSISTDRKQDPVLTPEELEMRIYSAAEEVSGNLF